MKKKQEKPVKKTLGGPQLMVIWAVIGFLIGCAIVFAINCGETILNYDWAGKWKQRCGQYGCHYPELK